MSFWLDDYLLMLDSVRAAGRVTQALSDYLQAPSTNAVILRHDVDRRPARAVQMATGEKQSGVRATYYFRCDRRGRFPHEACRHIASLGHEVGYHYEDLSQRGGDRAAAQAAFARNLAAFRRMAPCLTVSMHGSPLSRQDNGTLLTAVDLVALQLLGDATASLQAHQPVYFTDAGGAWNDPLVNFRDTLGLMPAGISPLDPVALTACLRRNPDRALCLNLHPERWAATPAQFAVSLAFDAGARLIKLLLAPRRR